jgi:hypothetical protein
MPRKKYRDVDEVIRDAVEEAVAPYADKAPPFVLQKMREVSERYFREHPEASRIMHLQLHKQRIISGDAGLAGVGDLDDAGETGTGKV